MATHSRYLVRKHNYLSYEIMSGVLMQYTFTIPVPTIVWLLLVVLAAVLAIIFFIVVLPIVKFNIVVSEDSIYVSAPPFAKVHVLRRDVSRIEVLNLSKHPELRPTLRTFGVGFPGYKVGWFKLANGAKAFLGVALLDQAVVMELKNGMYIIITPKNLNKFISALEELGWLK